MRFAPGQGFPRCSRSVKEAVHACVHSANSHPRRWMTKVVVLPGDIQPKTAHFDLPTRRRLARTHSAKAQNFPHYCGI